MKRVWKAKEVIKGWEGKPLTAQKAENPFDEDSDVSVGELTIFDAMFLISNISQIGNEVLCKTLEDASKKKSLKQALKVAKKTGLIELEAEVFRWLKTASEKVCPMLWQDNANEVHDIITEGFKKENEPSKSAGKKEGKEGKDASPAEKSAEPRIEEE